MSPHIKCLDMEKNIASLGYFSGVFVKVGGRPLHAECFVCSACKCSLKNVGE